jgi:arsenate reductase
LKIYGIPNCTTVKKARAWAAQRGIDLPFHDFKKDGISQPLLQSWLRQVDWQVLLNRSGTTWRKLPEPVKAKIAGPEDAAALMLDHPSIIKRPVLEKGGRLYVGFDEPTYRSLFERATR